MKTIESCINDAPIGLETYQEFGKEYATLIEDNAYNALFERPSTISLLPPLEGRKVLDAGCGPGAYTQHLLHRRADVVGLDVSPSMLAIARARFGDQAQFYEHDLARPLRMFKDAEFDVIVCSLAIHYVLKIESLFREFNRVLKPGGYLVFSTHHPMLDFSATTGQNYFTTELIEECWKSIGRPVQVRFYRRPLSTITNALAEAEFVIEKMHEGVLNEDLKNRFPKEFKKLSSQPQFIFFRTRKPL